MLSCNKVPCSHEESGGKFQIFSENGILYYSNKCKFKRITAGYKIKKYSKKNLDQNKIVYNEKTVKGISM